MSSTRSSNATGITPTTVGEPSPNQDITSIMDINAGVFRLDAFTLAVALLAEYSERMSEEYVSASAISYETEFSHFGAYNLYDLRSKGAASLGFPKSSTVLKQEDVSDNASLEVIYQVSGAFGQHSISIDGQGRNSSDENEENSIKAMRLMDIRESL
ncbi:hypothetical protein WG66_012822 [Moniliophthora roreri]|nr:hypothetical protein WG66_012822 [Moniliophthora roreri]